MKLFALLLLILLVTRSTTSYKIISSKQGSKKCDKLYFNRGNNDNNNDDDDNNKGWKSILRFIPGLSRARIEKTYESELEDTGNRYMIRLIMKSSSERRHTITRIQRFFPDILWETAEDIVDTALVNGISLIRVVNSRTDAEYLVDMLRRADPPITVEVFDNRKNEIVDI
jgi:hypothetical protein